MTDTPSRRENDEKFEIIIDRLDILETGQKDIVQRQEDHLEHEHIGLSRDQALELVDEHVNMVHDVGLTVELIAGKPIKDEWTGKLTGKREPGIAKRVEDLEFNSNGGRGFSIRNRDKLVIAGLTTLGLVLVEAIRLAFG
jgi:hypothetical protein